MLSSPRDLLRATIELYRKEFWLFLGYAAWLLVPTATFYFATALPPNPVTTVLIIVAIVLQIFVWLWIIVCLMKATALLSAGKKIDHDALSTQALRRIQPLLAVGFLQVLILLGGFLLLVVPSIIFWVWYSLAQTATGLDDKRPVESLTYSRTLTRGRFYPVLWRLLFGPVIIGLLYVFVSGFILLGLAQTFGVNLGDIFGDTPPLWTQLVQSAVDIFFVPLFLIYSVLLYQDIKAHALDQSPAVA